MYFVVRAAGAPIDRHYSSSCSVAAKQLRNKFYSGSQNIAETRPLITLVVANTDKIDNSRR
jgi:hypothetical protein